MILRGKPAVALLGLLVGALVLASASSAGATLPEIGHCVKQTPTVEGNKKSFHGKYTNRKCTKESTGSTGKFEWVGGPGAEKEFESPGTLEPVTLETAGGTVISCEDSKMSGEYLTAKTEKVSIGLYGCKDTATNLPCQSLRPEETPPTAQEGTILSQPAEAELGYINSHGTKPTVGWRYKPKTGTDLFVFECGKPIEPPPLSTTGDASPDTELPTELPTLVTIEGSFIGRVKPVDRPVEEFHFTYLAPGGKQQPEMFEGGEKAVLTADIEKLPSAPVTEQIGYAGVEEESTVEPYEIKAIA